VPEQLVRLDGAHRNEERGLDSVARQQGAGETVIVMLAVVERDGEERTVPAWLSQEALVLARQRAAVEVPREVSEQCVQL
jgi:hypothetical protein